MHINIFVKYAYIFQSKRNFHAKCVIVCVSVSLFNDRLNRRQTLPMFFCHQSVMICCTHTYNWKRERHLIAFSDKCEHSSVRSYQNSKSGSFLMTSCNIEPEPMWMNSRYSVVSKFIAHSQTLNGCFIQAGFCNIIHWPFGKYQFTEMCRSSKCSCISRNTIKYHIS